MLSRGDEARHDHRRADRSSTSRGWPPPLIDAVDQGALSRAPLANAFCSRPAPDRRDLAVLGLGASRQI